MNSSIEKVLFIGATGTLAKPVVQALLEADFEVTAMVRNLAKARKVVPKDVRLVEGDLQNKHQIASAVVGQDAVYLNLSISQNEKKSGFHSESDGIQNLLPLAKEAGIRRILHLSSLVQRYQGTKGFHWWAFDVKEQGNTLIKQSGIPYTIFYPSTFMESIPYIYRQGNKLLLAGKSEQKMFFIAGADYGKQVANSLKILQNENAEYSVQGQDGYTAEEACKLFAQHYTQAKLSISKAPLGLLKFLGNFMQKMNYAGHIIEALNKYPERFESEKTWNELGKPQITLSEFAKLCE